MNQFAEFGAAAAQENDAADMPPNARQAEHGPRAAERLARSRSARRHMGRYSAEMIELRHRATAKAPEAAAGRILAMKAGSSSKANPAFGPQGA
jgi:hypothetical protein